MTPDLLNIALNSDPLVVVSCWVFARGSAERMLHHVYGLGKAPWFNDEVFEGFDSDGCEQ